MVTGTHSLQTEITSSEDNLHTYEIHKKWSGKGRKGIVIELYPTLSADRCAEMDVSMLHLMNHVQDFTWGEVSILNLYSTVFASKPITKMLARDEENAAYIGQAVGQGGKDCDIVIAWGCSLNTHRTTNEMKLDLLEMMAGKKLDGQVKYIVTESMDDLVGSHPLYCGLHYGREKWSLKKYPLKQSIKELKDSLREKTKPKKQEKAAGRKGEGEDVLQDKEPA